MSKSEASDIYFMVKENNVKEIIIVAHCILNQASKVKSDGNDKEEQEREKFLDYVRDKKIQLIQLPCPEFMLYGSRRWGHVRDQLDHPYYRQQCRHMLEPVLLQCKEYAAYPSDYLLSTVIAIGGSPSCGYHLTCRGDWGGEMNQWSDLQQVREHLFMEKNSGVFMGELQRMLSEEKLDIPIVDLSDFVKMNTEPERE